MCRLGAYFLRAVWWQKMWRFNAPGKRHDAIVRDKITLGSAVIVVVATAMVIGALTGGWTSAVWLPTKLFVVPFLLFVQIIGWTVYVHHVDPDIRWWTRREWTQFNGQMESTTVVRVPALVNRCGSTTSSSTCRTTSTPASPFTNCRGRPATSAPRTQARSDLALVDRSLPARHPRLQAVRLRNRSLAARTNAVHRAEASGVGSDDAAASAATGRDERQAVGSGS